MRHGNVAEILCEALAGEGVDVLFGHPGGAILPFYDALHRLDRPRHVLVRHEQAAAHAADGYARATGRVGVCVATSGPGATNLVTGLATAMMDSVPLVAITGQVPTAAMGTEAFQETDILGITLPVTKHGFVVDRPEEIRGVVREAFRLARGGRPGPVLIDLPKDVQTAVLADPDGQGFPPEGLLPPVARPSRNGKRPRVDPLARELRRAAVLVNEARRPVLMVGRGVVLSGTCGLARTLAERADLPVVTTLLGLDGFPSTHPQALGLPGMHGSERANRALQAADVILGLGLRFDDRVTGPPASFAPRARIVHLDVDPVSVGRTVRPAVAVIGDLRDTLPRLVPGIRPARRLQWWRELRGWARDADESGEDVLAPGPLTGRAATRAVAARVARSGAVLVTDVGQHQMWMAQELGDAAPGTHLTSGGLGTMGYALPAAMGAALGRPDVPVWVVAGDGGFQMTCQELATVVQERLPIRIAVVNNGFLGMVRQWQELFYEGRYSASELSGPDLVVLARAFGVPAARVDRAEALEDALDRAEAARGPVLLELRVVPEEKVYPMVPPGASLDEMVKAPAPVPVS